VRAEARRVVVHGIVQGVGFRPFVWRLSQRLGLSGWVRNAGGVVEIQAEGDAAALDAFETALSMEAPPMARVLDIRSRSAPLEEAGGFRVDPSSSAPDPGNEVGLLVSPDAATCAACRAELFDPTDRRYRYPFINCTDCGPRFTIIDALPYDRARTSMRTFPMCGDCRREYEDPADRRFHAEPVACPRCGPRIAFLGADGRPTDVTNAVADPAAALEAAADLVVRGGVVALKGLGGFHLTCDAADEAAVRRLRERKRRPDQPFAVMVRDADAAADLFLPTEVERAVLASWRAPIVLVRDRGVLAPSVAPGYARQGVMLPSTPLHHLLLHAAGRPLVMTSGNVSHEPICTDEAEATVKLRGIADAFIVHDRPIVARYDDPVVRVRRRDPIPSVLRRARSYAPDPVRLAVQVRPSLGTGALLHGAFCLAVGDRAYLSQHVGDLDTEEAMAAYAEAFDRYRDLLGIEPEVVAHDLHPDFATTRFARTLGVRTVAVQHHHAHVAATMAEHGLAGEVLGLAFDGLGLGDDGTVWGGEMLACSAAGYRRLGHLRAVRQPGGDAATRDPVRSAIAHAADAGALEDALALLGPDPQTVAVTLRQIASGLNTPLSSSAGRLFDAVAALAGVCRRATYEGHPAILLEEAADRLGSGSAAVALDPPPPARGVGGMIEVDTRPLVASAIARLARLSDPEAVAAGFHSALAEGVASAALLAAGETGLERAVLGGGVFANDRFSAALVARLTAGGLRVFLPHEVPVGDGGIALGQVLVANARSEER
jgi:hydrogenase maturation protein HypF